MTNAPNLTVLEQHEAAFDAIRTKLDDRLTFRGKLRAQLDELNEKAHTKSDADILTLLEQSGGIFTDEINALLHPDDKEDIHLQQKKLRALMQKVDHEIFRLRVELAEHVEPYQCEYHRLVSPTFREAKNTLIETMKQHVLPLIEQLRVWQAYCYPPLQHASAPRYLYEPTAPLTSFDDELKALIDAVFNKNVRLIQNTAPLPDSIPLAFPRKMQEAIVHAPTLADVRRMHNTQADSPR